MSRIIGLVREHLLIKHRIKDQGDLYFFIIGITRPQSVVQTQPNLATVHPRLTCAHTALERQSIVLLGPKHVCGYRARDITERPHAPSGVAAFMSAHSKTPYITLVWIFTLGMG